MFTVEAFARPALNWVDHGLRSLPMWKARAAVTLSILLFLAMGMQSFLVMSSCVGEFLREILPLICDKDSMVTIMHRVRFVDQNHEAPIDLVTSVEHVFVTIAGVSTILRYQL
jgi:hypothetical protein